MKKGYYLYGENCGSSGVINKIRMQISTFSKYFDIEGIQIKSSSYGAVRRAYNLMPWASFGRDYSSALEDMVDPDFVYVRRVYIDPAYIRFLRDIHKKWPKCKIIVEQPVYPYEKDMLNSFYTKFHYVKEQIYKCHYKDDIDRFVTYSDDEEILGVSTIRTMNGVNVDEISTIDTAVEYNPNHIKIVAVATLVAHHGYERIIEGLNEYYRNGGERFIELRVIGEGPEKLRYQTLASRLNLSANITFYGEKRGEDLDALLADADAGLSAFGAYKEGVEKLCTIKTREYLAKGLPVISGCDDNVFHSEIGKYSLVFDNDDSVVDISRIVDFLDSIYLESGKNSTILKTREMAYKTVDNEVTLAPVIKYIVE